jgi:DNA-binding response OmpR family regulator
MADLQIVLADDDADDREFFQEALSEAGIQAILTTLENGDELMDFLSDIKEPPPPHIIILDINMPRKSGKACLLEIRKDKKFDDTPIIMFSTSTHHKDIEDTYNQGANLYVSKLSFFMNDIESMKSLFSADWKKQLAKRPRDKYVFAV